MERGEKCGRGRTSYRGCVEGGLIVLHWKDGHSNPILKDLVAVTDPACGSKLAKDTSSEELHSSDELHSSSEFRSSLELKTSEVIRRSIESSHSFGKRHTFSLKRTFSDNWLTELALMYGQASADKERRELTAAIKSLLATEAILRTELDKHLKQKAFIALRKTELLYKRWLERVSLPILQAIEDHIDKESISVIETRRQKQLALYLEFCNKKGFVFLDRYDPGEYDPYYLQQPDFKVKTPPLHDPLLRPLRDRHEEEVTVLQCETGRTYTAKEIDELHKQRLPIVPVKRKRPKGIEWVKMPFGYIESDVRRRSRQRIICHSNVGTPKFQIEEKRTPNNISISNHKRKASDPSSLPSSATPVIIVASDKLSAV